MKLFSDSSNMAWRWRRSPVALLLTLIPAAASLWSQSPNADDLTWQKSNGKFDQARGDLLRRVDQKAAAGPFHPTWESLQNYKIPEWYLDAKFGIFIHWGVYSVPAFGSEWYPRTMYIEGTREFQHEVAAHGSQAKFGYKDFIPDFKAARFDPQAWAELFRNAGAKYVIPVAEHHDGFAMYRTSLSDWNAANMGPHRDIVGELADAVRAKGLHFGASSHRAEHYFFFNGGREIDSDVRDPRFASFYGPAHQGVTDKNHQEWKANPDSAYLDDWLARTAEIVARYHPEVVWFDWWIQTKEFEPYRKRFAAYYYDDAASRGSTAVINYKYNAYPDGAAVLDIERGQMDKPRPLFWQTDTSISIKSWGYIDNDTFKTPESLIQQLVDIVSKNGCLLLNVGPKPDGTIPDQAQEILLDMGRWLSTNGEAIYGTRPWTIAAEGPTQVVGGAFHDTATLPYTGQDIRFTTKGNILYAIALGWPAEGKITIKSLAQSAAPDLGHIDRVQLLGAADTQLNWTRDADGLRIKLPSPKTGEYAYAFRITHSSR